MIRWDAYGNKHFTSKLHDLLTDRDMFKVLTILKNEKLSNLVDCDGTTFLHLSIQHRNKFLINHLIYNKIFDINTVDRFGNTLLMFSIRNNNDIDVLETFLNAGADLCYLKDKSNQSALIMIIEKYRHCKETLKLVMDEIEKRCQSIEEMADALFTAGCQLYHLDMFKKVEITKLLIERGRQVNNQDSYYFSNMALHVAAQINDVENVKILLQYGARKFIENSQRRPPIAYISSNLDTLDPELINLLLPDEEDWIVKANYMKKIFSKCHQGVLEYLIYHQGIDLNAQDAQGRRPVHYLVKNEDIQIEKLLKNVLLDINVQDNRGLFPMHTAVRVRNVEAIQYLIDSRANLNISDKKNRSPLCYIFSTCRMFPTEYIESTDLLLINGADVQQLCVIRDSIVYKLQMYNDFNLKNLLSHHLAILEARATTLNPIILSLINAYDPLKHLFAECQQELVELKKIIVFDAVTLFQFLIDDNEKICRYARNEGIVEEFAKFKGTSYFFRLMRRRFQQALDINRWREMSGEFISECIEPLQGCSLVVGKILDLLRVIDLKVIAKYTEQIVK